MLRTRIITSMLLLAGLATVLFLLPPGYMAVIFACVVAIAAWEWSGLLKNGSSARLAYGAFNFFVCVAIYYFGMPDQLVWLLWCGSSVFWLLIVPIWLRHRWILHADMIGLIVGMILLIPSWAAMVVLYTRGSWLLLATMGLVWVADISAYFFGRILGRRKLAETISPGKTWEGAAGAVASVIVYGLVLLAMTGYPPITGMLNWVAVALGLSLLTAVSIMGDLFESMAKRQANLKDSSGLLPGHGGVLDRIDSLTSTFPFVAMAIIMLT